MSFEEAAEAGQGAVLSEPGAVRAVLRAALPHLLADLRALADEWAGQPRDYDEGTEQQIADGYRLREALDRLTEEAGR